MLPKSTAKQHARNQVPVYDRQRKRERKKKRQIKRQIDVQLIWTKRKKSEEKRCKRGTAWYKRRPNIKLWHYGVQIDVT